MSVTFSDFSTRFLKSVLFIFFCPWGHAAMWTWRECEEEEDMGECEEEEDMEGV